MAFVLETGAGLTNSNAYISVTFFKEFHSDRGRSIGEFSATEISAAIIRATDYIDKRFGKKFKGSKANSGQSLEWPRSDVWDNSGDRVDSDELPKQLLNATAEYTRLALAFNDLLPTPARGFATIDETTGGVVTTQTHVARTRQVVGPIEDEIWYHDTAKREFIRSGGATSDLVSSDYLPEYPVADEWLNQLVNAGMPTRLGRA